MIDRIIENLISYFIKRFNKVKDREVLNYLQWKKDINGKAHD